jgi:benzoyl-CoA reductase/2-hydroxyglutaryl-CoA dehydratase subunit BcrC/BadD/HgdB
LRFGEVFGNFEQHLRELSGSGGTIIGYVYPHAPLELILAHGITPSLVSTNPSVQGGFEASLQTFSCSLTRNLFGQRSNGGLPFLSGLLFPSNTCDSLHNVSDVWRRRFPEDKVFKLTYPAARPSEDSIQFLAQELRILSQSLKDAYGRPLSIDGLSTAANLINEFREAAQTLYSCRIVDPDVVSYLEAARMVRNFLALPSADAIYQIKDSANVASQILEEKGQLTLAQSLQKELLGETPEEAGIEVESDGPRILVAGGMVEPMVVASLFKGSDRIEGEVVTSDLLSFGFKTAFTPPVNLAGDPFVAISRSILGAPLEPTQEGLPRRLEFLKRVLSRLSIDGLVVCEQSFCDPDQFEAPSLLKAASEANVPSLRLPIDPELSDRNRLEGRIQSFLETFEGGTR